jgi:lysophospholipase L1-like esterase
VIHENIDFHGSAELRELDDHDGLLLQRVPESVRQHLNPGAQEAMLSPANSEIRFVCESDNAKIALHSSTPGFVFPFFGVYQYPLFFALSREKETYRLDLQAPLKGIDPKKRIDRPFSSGVWRLTFGGWCGGPPTFFHSLEARGVRPPLREELPKLTMLTYGTSITHGACASGPHFTYVGQLARRLGVDVVNFGVGGSAFCEHELADYFAARKDWDFAVLALSVNMIGFEIDEYHERLSYMVNTVAGSNTNRPVFCVTLYPFFADLCNEKIFTDRDMKAPAGEYRRRLRDSVASCPHPNVHLFEGPDILDDSAGLTSDLIHPGDFGMQRMAENLAERIRPVIEQF